MKLYPFQERGVEFLIQGRRRLLADEMGVGKTPQAIVALKRLAHDDGILPVLVLTTASMIYTWAEELHRWWPELSDVCVVTGTAPQRGKLWASPSDVYICSYQTFLRDYDGCKWAGGVVLDEAHKIKNRKTKLFRAIASLTRFSAAVFQLTGTPILKHPADLWSLLHILDPKAHPSFWRFVRAYCHVEFDGFKMDIGDLVYPGELSQRTAQYALRREKSVLGAQLPPKTVQQRWVALSEEHRRQYDRLLKDFFLSVDVDAPALAAVNVISRDQYLRQLILDPSLCIPEERGVLRGAKIEALFDILEDLAGAPAVIFTTSARAARRLYTQMLQEGYGVALICGDTPVETRPQIVARFQNALGVDYLICSIRAGGEGITLTRAQTAIFLDKDWVPEINKQAQDRLHRIGQASPVHIIELLARDTLDVRVEELNAQRVTVTLQVLREATVDQ